MRVAYIVACCGLAILALSACSTVVNESPTTSPSARETMTVDLGGGVSMDMVLIPAGSFTMGSDKGEDNEKPVHKVTLTRPFYMGKYSVTQAQWQAVMGDNPSQFKGPTNPVEEVSWEDCQEFLQALAKKVPGKVFELPTEAQWEYACRAGTTTDYYFGDDPAKLGDYAWYLDNAGNHSHPVGQKKPNNWGLYDMHGNVCQWCADWFGSYAPGDATDPTGPTSGEAAVLRGESWVGLPHELRSAGRVATPIYYRNSHVGLRLVCLVPEASDQ
ncbi:MAG: formylglycine-generating enzyme family protein [Tepidisphaeraceae bacterium]